MALRENKKAKAPQLCRVLSTTLGRGIRAAKGHKGSKHRKTAPFGDSAPGGAGRGNIRQGR